MRKKILVLVFLLLTSSNLVNWNFENKNSYSNINFENINENKNIWKITKKELKKEIKQRKKYHKTLLEQYNTNFDVNILWRIKENSLILSNLRYELKN